MSINHSTKYLEVGTLPTNQPVCRWDQDVFCFIKLSAVLVLEIILDREPAAFGILDSFEGTNSDGCALHRLKNGLVLHYRKF